MNENQFTEVIPVEKIRGCYLLWKNGDVVYVGQSENVFSRIGAHIANNKKNFDGYSYCHFSGNLNDEEARLIAWKDYYRILEFQEMGKA